MVTTPCKAENCKKKIIYAHIIKEDGTAGVIPLDSSAPYYRIRMDERSGKMLAEREHMAFVSHFCTCVGANKFSNRGSNA